MTTYVLTCSLPGYPAHATLHAPAWPELARALTQGGNDRAVTLAGATEDVPTVGDAP